MALSPAARRLVADGTITASEVAGLSTVARTAPGKADLKELATRYGDLFQPSARAAFDALGAGSGVRLGNAMRSLGDTTAGAKLLRGELVLSRSQNAKDPAVAQVQRALNALANREGDAAVALVGFGADGGYGAEMERAVSAFQSSRNLPVTGAVDAATARAIEGELMSHAPARNEWQATQLPDGDRIADAARELVATRGADYGVPGVWKSPNPAIPGNRRPEQTAIGAKDHWKCNLFGLDSLYKAGAETPHYAGGWYPIALDIPKFTRGPNAPLINEGEVKFTGPDHSAQRAEVEALLARARPGDILIVNHQGPDIADGGHTRIVVENRFAQDGTLVCAQAGQDSAVLRAENLERLSGREEAIHLLRPAKLRG